MIAPAQSTESVSQPAGLATGQLAPRHLVILPAYNEELALPSTIAQLERLPEHFELLVVNDGSRDKTAAVARELQKTCTRKLHLVSLPENCGIGAAVQTGYLFAARKDCYRYCIQFDADGQHNVDYILALTKTCDERQLDLCVGSRFLAGTGVGFQSTFARRIGIRFFAWLISRLSGANVTDPTSGFRCAGPAAWKNFAVRYPDDYPEPESLFWCARNGLKVGEIPVQMFERTAGSSSIKQLRSVYYMLKVTLAILVDSLRRTERRAV